MANNPQQIILQILNIINYSDEKQKFANEFLGLCQIQAMADLVKDLSEDQQKFLGEKLKDEKDPKRVWEVLEQELGKEKVEESLKKAASTAMDGYLKEVEPTLSETQKNELDSYFKTL